MKIIIAILSLIFTVNVYGAVLNLDDYAASETSIYDHLNDNIDKLEAILNSGLEGDNFDSDFSIGSDQIGANAITNTQLQDHCIDEMNIQTGAVDTRIILDGTILDDDMSETIRPDNFFDRRSRLTFTYQTDVDFEDRWRFECEEAFMAHPEDFRISNWLSDVWQFTAIFIKNNTGYIGLYNEGSPQAQLDIGGTLRVQGQSSFEGGVSNPWTLLTVNSIYPNVKGGNNFYTANTGTGTPTLSPITYNNFYGGVDGQRILVRVMDVFTIFSSADSSSLWTQDTSADWGALSAAEQGVIYEFQLDGTDWYCLNRYGPFYQGTAGGGTPPSFGGASEDWESGGQAGGSGWVAGSTWTYAGSNQAGIKTDDPHAGTYAAGIATGATFDRPLVTSSGDTTITVYAKKYTGTPILYIYDSTNGTTFTELTHVTAPAAYTAIPYTWTMADTTEYIRFGCGGTGALWLDDITIE